MGIREVMHEITILVQLVHLVEKEAKANNIEEKIDSIVIQLGQLTSIVPMYLKEYYPNVTEGTLLEDSKIEIEMIKANGLCHHCNKVFGIIEHKGKCPYCKQDDWEMLSGQEFLLKEIRIKES